MCHLRCGTEDHSWTIPRETLQLKKCLRVMRTLIKSYLEMHAEVAGRMDIYKTFYEQFGQYLQFCELVKTLFSQTHTQHTAHDNSHAKQTNMHTQHKTHTNMHTITLANPHQHTKHTNIHTNKSTNRHKHQHTHTTHNTHTHHAQHNTTQPTRIVKVVKVFPQKCVFERIGERIVDVWVPRILEEFVEVILLGEEGRSRPNSAERR